MFKFLEELKDAIPEITDQVSKILTSTANQFELFMAQKVRAKVQEKRIAELCDWVKEGGVGRRVILMIDSKLKVEPERHREP